MKKINTKIWFYAIVFLGESISFNVALVFAVISLVTNNHSLTKWSIVAIISASLWLTQIIIKHLIWLKMQKNERAIFLVFRKQGNKILKLKNNELKKSGQSDIREFLSDVDSKIEIGMLINGAATLINVFIGIKWFIHAIKWHKNPHSLNYEIEE